jgi:hypothetical protein
MHAWCFALLLGATPSFAQAPPDADDSPRYSYGRVDEGYLRLDLRTGAVSLCARRQAGWSCQTVPDDRAALDGEIARLQSENIALKRALLDRNLPLPSTVRPSPSDQTSKNEARPPELKVPDNAELDRVMSFVEKLWRRLIDMVGAMQRHLNKS